jgi:hypothetical protein
MRDLTPGEILQLRELLNMETVAMTSMQGAKPLITDSKLKAACDTGIQACEGRIRAMQQFIQENGIANVQGVQ